MDDIEQKIISFIEDQCKQEWDLFDGDEFALRISYKLLNHQIFDLFTMDGKLNFTSTFYISHVQNATDGYPSKPTFRIVFNYLIEKYDLQKYELHPMLIEFLKK